MFRRSLAALLALASIAACASSGEDEKAGSDPASAPESIVGASQESRSDLGVNEWVVTQGDTDRSLLVVGLDASGATKASMSVVVEPNADGTTGVITYDVTAPEAFRLRYEVLADRSARSNVEDSATTPLAQKVIALAGKDLRSAEASKTANGSLLGKQSLDIQGRATGGLVNSGGKLVKTGQCLRDSSGNGCVGQLLQTAGGVVATGVCLLASGFTLGLATAACAAGGVATIGSAVSMYESGCKLRPCTSSSAPTS